MFWCFHFSTVIRKEFPQSLRLRSHWVGRMSWRTFQKKNKIFFGSFNFQTFCQNWGEQMSLWLYLVSYSILECFAKWYHPDFVSYQPFFDDLHCQQSNGITTGMWIVKIFLIAHSLNIEDRVSLSHSLVAWFIKSETFRFSKLAESISSLMASLVCMLGIQLSSNAWILKPLPTLHSYAFFNNSLPHKMLLHPHVSLPFGITVINESYLQYFPKSALLAKLSSFIIKLYPVFAKRTWFMLVRSLNPNRPWSLQSHNLVHFFQ